MNAIEKLTVSLKSQLDGLSDAAYDAALDPDNGFRFDDQAAAEAAMAEALAELGIESDAQHFLRWGPCHRAANLVNARLREAGIPAADWSHMALLAAVGVDLGEVDRQWRAERAQCR